MNSPRREQRAWYVYDWANSAFSTTVVTALFGPYLTELVRAAASPDGRVVTVGFSLDYRAVWEWLLAFAFILARAHGSLHHHVRASSQRPRELRLPSERKNAAKHAAVCFHAGRRTLCLAST